MEKDNISVVLKRQGELCLEKRNILEPKPNEALIAINSAGICGSDIHYWKHGHIGEHFIRENRVLGHESSGTVLKVGNEVKHLKPGDRVCIEPGVPCKKCEFCKKGRYNLCSTAKYDNPATGDGSLCRYYCHDAEYCFRLPSNVSLKEGALMEPLAVAVHACRKAGVSAGKSILICGAGAIGLLVLLTCRAVGARRICITDICEERLSTAKKLGADFPINVKNMETKVAIKEVTTRLEELPDITIECSGAESSIAFGIKVTKAGGKLMLVGMGSGTVNLDLVDATRREIDICGVYRYTNCFPIALELVSSGAVDVKPLITHTFPIKDAVEAFQTSATGADGAIKVLIQCSQ